MTVKRRNGDRNKHGLGRTKFIGCSGYFPKDKARFLARNIVEEAAAGDVQEACAIEQYMLPNSYIGCNIVFLVPLTQKSLGCDP